MALRRVRQKTPRASGPQQASLYQPLVSRLSRPPLRAARPSRPQALSFFAFDGRVVEIGLFSIGLGRISGLACVKYLLKVGSVLVIGLQKGRIGSARAIGSG